MTETPKRRGRPPKQTEFGREFLLTNALTEFAKNGYEGTSLRTIASLSNVDVALIAHHFGSKMELWKAAVDYLASRIRNKAPFNNYPSFEGKDISHNIQQFIDDLVEFSFEHPYHGMFLTHEAINVNERSKYFMDKLLLPIFQEIKPFIEGCMQAGIIQKQEPVVFFLMLLNSVSLLAIMPHYAAQLSGNEIQTEHFKSEMKKSVVANFFHHLLDDK